ncbi:MAG: hypothetical protein IKO10_12255 [Lachnospiraceae bacterium]|nr:hypothetical protein [Lachnospiraceae bacterium]
MEKIKNAVSSYFKGMDDAVITTRREVFLQIVIGVLAGIILGILIAPPRKVKIGCDNGTNIDGGCDGGCGCGCGKEQNEDED